MKIKGYIANTNAQIFAVFDDNNIEEVTQMYGKNDKQGILWFLNEMTNQYEISHRFIYFYFYPNANKNLIVHHIRDNKSRGPHVINNLNNLILLSKDDHTKLHEAQQEEIGRWSL